MNELRPCHGWRFWSLIAAAVLVGVPLLLAVLVLAVLNTGAGQRFAERKVAALTGGTVTLAGLHGRVPDALRLDHVAIRDATGVWLTADGIVLDWSPLHLLGGTASVQALTAQAVSVLRLPVSAPTPAKPAAAPFHLPVTVDVQRLAIADLALGAPVAGSPAHLAADGSAQLRQLDRGTIRLALRRTDAPGSYAVTADLTDGAINGHLSAQEPAHGLISGAAHLPELGALGIDATIAGPWTAAGLRAAIAAGPLRAGANGTLDLRADAASLAVSVHAPAMTPAPGIAWQSVALDATLTGPFAHPAATGTLAIAGIAANGTTIDRIAGTLKADTHTASLAARLQGVVLAPPNQALLAAGDVNLTAGIDLDAPTRPFTLRFDHPLLTGTGSGVLAPDLSAMLAVTLPDLERLARPLHRDVTGHAGFTLAVARHAAATRIALDAALAVTGGADAPAATRGTTTLGATVTLGSANDPADITLSRLKLDGSSVHATATGTRHADQVQADWTLQAADIHELAPSLRGALGITGHLAGTQQRFAATADVTGTLGTDSLAPAPVALHLRGTGLPGDPAGHVDGTASLAGSPLTVDIDATRDPAINGTPGALHIAINRADWKSAAIAGALVLPPSAPGHTTLPTGGITLRMARLADLQPVIHQPVVGSLQARLDLPAGAPAVLHAELGNAGLAGQAMVARTVLDARVTNPTATPTVAATLAATGLRAGSIAGDLRLTANGPTTALALKLTSSLRQLAGADAAITAAATLDTAAHALTLATLGVNWHDLTIALAGPARLTYAPVVAVDRLRLTASTKGAATASLDVAGTISPSLALTVVGRNITPALAAPFASELKADGQIALDARLAGTPAAPTGTIRLAATGLHLRSGPAAGLPAAKLTANATLAGTLARLDATLAAGPATQITLAGGVPLSATGPLSLQADGRVGLAVLDPILTAQGRRVRGTLTLVASIAGTPVAPDVQGNLRLADGEIQDFAQGIHITDIAALIRATGDAVHIDSFSGRAGGGTVSVAGSVGLRGEMPVAITITATNARPITSDLVTATLDANLSVTGQAQTSVAASGRIHVRRADIQVPDKLPATVVVLNVRRPGDKPAAPAAPGLQIPLDITLDAPQQIFVRGHGLDAEMGGRLHVGGTAAAPQTSGGIELRRGTFSLAGTTLTFTSGDISFNGATKIDPALNLIATSSTADLVATLTVGGYASAPKITLSSVPDRPQDEVLSALLFHQSAASLSPFQLAQIAAALAQVSGIGGGGPDPLSRLRKGLGLDRLSVGSSGTGSTATTDIEAGRYVAPGVYVGAKQGTSGAQTQAEVQIDLLRGLKLNSDVGSGPGGSNVGLTYQFQY